MNTRSIGLMAAIIVPAALAPTGLAQVEVAAVAAQAAPAAPDRPKLGITVESDGTAVTIVTLNPKGAAAAAGLKVGDQLVSMDGESLGSIDALTAAIAKHKIGDQAKLAVKRGGESMNVVVNFAAAPAAPESGVRTGPALRAEPEKADKPDEVAKADPMEDAPVAVAGRDHGFLGVNLEMDEAATIGEVLDDGPADKAGLRAGDVVKSIGGHAVASTDELRERLIATKPGQEVEIVVLRDGEEKTRTIRLGSASDVAMNAAPGAEPAAPAEPRAGAGRGTAKRFRVPVGENGAGAVTLKPPANQPKIAAPQKRAQGWLGVYLAPTEDGGVAVQSVVEDGPGAKAGFAEGDVITRIGDKDVSDPNELVEIVRSLAPGDVVAFTVNRGGKETRLEASLGKNPSNGAIAMPETAPVPNPPKTAEPAAPRPGAERRARAAAALRGPSVILAPNEVLTAKVVANGDGSYTIQWGDGRTLNLPSDGRRVLVLRPKGEEGVELMLLDPAAAGGRLIRALDAQPPAANDEGGGR